MTNAVQEMFAERLKRYQAAIALQVPDRVPISSGSNYFAEVYAGFDKQEFIYDASTWMAADEKFVRDFPEVDSLRNGRFWGPLHDAVGFNLYKLPGRELSPGVQFQFVEGERMKADEYDLLVQSPVEFMFERFLPRVLNEFGERGSLRSYVAFLKGGLAAARQAQWIKERNLQLENRLGMPSTQSGGMLAPFDYLADALRGLNGIMLDLFQRPDKVREACDAIVPDIVNAALAGADPLRRIPIFMPLHRGCRPFLSPRQFADFYWPSLKKAMTMILAAGYTLRLYLEGDWGTNWHYFREMPKGKILLDIDVQGDILKAKEEIGDWQCLAGGMPDVLLILGRPQEVRDRVRVLCEKVGRDGGFIINGGCGIPHDTKPENYRAMLDAVLEFGRYGEKTDFAIRSSPHPPAGWTPPGKRVITPWEVKRRELGEIAGDESLIQAGWEELEHQAFNWIWSWVW